MGGEIELGPIPANHRGLQIRLKYNIDEMPMKEMVYMMNHIG